MYRVGGIAVYDGHPLVEQDVGLVSCNVPGGRVEYGEKAVEALVRELHEELGQEVKVGRLLLVADNLFEIGGDRFQDITLYFLIEFAPGSRVLERIDTFEGGEPGDVFQWMPLAEVEQANLVPPFLRQLARDLPAYPEYIAHAEPGFLYSDGHDPHPDG